MRDQIKKRFLQGWQKGFLEQQVESYKGVPQRPALMPLCLCALMFWAVCALTYSRGSLCSMDLAKLLSVVAFAGCLICAIVGFKAQKNTMLFFVMASACLGVALGSYQTYALLTSSSAIDDQKVVSGKLHLLEDSSLNGYYETAKASLELDDGRSLTVQSRFPRQKKASSEVSYISRLNDGDKGIQNIKESFLFGETLSVQGKLMPIDYLSNSYAWQNGFVATFQIDTYEPDAAAGVSLQMVIETLAKLRGRVIALYPKDDESSVLLQAITCGYRRNLKGSDLYGSYQTCGLAHLVAVSGAHLVIIVGLFASMFKALNIPRKLVIGILVLIMVLYLILAGAPLSALRAVVMSSVGILALLGKRRPSSQNALGLSIFGIIAVDPTSAVSASFALSALSTLGIVLFAPLFTVWIGRTFLRKLPFVVDALALTCAASLLSQGLACSMFSLLPLVSPLANILSAFLFPFVCSFGFFAAFASLVSLPGVQLLSAGVQLSATVLNALVEHLAHVPYAAIPFTCDASVGLAISFLIAALLWMTWDVIQRRILLSFGGVALVVALIWWVGPSTADRIVMFDVGQGDSFLLQSKGESLLIDTGNQDSKLLKALASAHVTTLNLVALTHPDDDHIGSLNALRKGVEVQAYAVPDGLTRAPDDKSSALMDSLQQTGTPLIALKAGDAFVVGNFTLHVLWPLDYTQGGNVDSLCLWVEYDGNADGKIDFTALFTGDAEADQLQQIIEEYELSSVDILKIGHHGSSKALTSEQAQSLSPRIALVSVGAHNRYGHPSSSILGILESAATKIVRSDLEGTKEMRLTSERLVVQ